MPAAPSERRPGRMVRLAALLLSGAALLAACVASPDQAREQRRASYLDCARAQGVPVREGTIRPRGRDDLRRLDACEALPR